jgi:hypothetical protein
VGSHRRCSRKVSSHRRCSRKVSSHRRCSRRQQKYIDGGEGEGEGEGKGKGKSGFKFKYWPHINPLKWYFTKFGKPVQSNKVFVNNTDKKYLDFDRQPDNINLIPQDTVSPDDINLTLTEQPDTTIDIPNLYANNISQIDSLRELTKINNLIPNQGLKKEENEFRAEQLRQEWRKSGGKRTIRKTKHRVRRN